MQKLHLRERKSLILKEITRFIQTIHCISTAASILKNTSSSKQPTTLTLLKEKECKCMKSASMCNFYPIICRSKNNWTVQFAACYVSDPRSSNYTH